MPVWGRAACLSLVGNVELGRSGIRLYASVAMALARVMGDEPAGWSVRSSECSSRLDKNP